MELNRDIIHKRLQKLANGDKHRKVFGSASHNYALNPPLDVAEIEAFESKHQTSLPEDYRYFLTEIGNGGAGPSYGLFPFGYDDEGRWGEILPIGDLGQRFPHDSAWNLDGEFWKAEPEIPEAMPKMEEQRLLDEWDKKLEANYWHPSIIDGAIPICHLGCALRQWLVVHGNQRGYVWDDMRADHAGIAPVKNADGKPMTFTNWYLQWLDDAERGGKKQAIVKVPYRMQVPRSRRELLTLLLLIVAGVLLGLLLALFRDFPWSDPDS